MLCRKLPIETRILLPQTPLSLLLSDCHCLSACYRRKIVKKVIQGMSPSEVIPQRFHRNPYPDKGGSSTENVRIAMHDNALICHTAAFLFLRGVAPKLVYA